MPATVNVLISKTVLSTAGAQANGEAIRASGHPVTVQIVAANAVGRVEQSQDGHNWVVATHQNGTDVTALGSGMYTLDDRAEWVRPATVADASPETVEFVFSIMKES